MRDKRFIAVHRGGLLLPEHHRLLMRWAIVCAEHLLPLYGQPPGEQLLLALSVARRWADGAATVGEARKASVACLSLARECSDPVAVSVVRAVGHAVATAHMADHALGPAWYGMKAVKAAGLPLEPERTWQNEQLPPEIRELVLETTGK